MYKLKEGKYEEIKLNNPKFRVKEMADKIGIKPCFTSLILNRRRVCSKTVAYCFVKAVDSKLEIEDMFDRV